MEETQNHQKQQVTILAASYSPDSDEVVWQVELKNGDIYPIVWKKAEYSKFVGVSGEIPLLLLDEHLNAMVGKTNVTLIVEDIKSKPADVPIAHE